MVTKKPGLCSCLAGLMFSWLWEDVVCVLRNYWENFQLSNLVFERVISFGFNTSPFKRNLETPVLPKTFCWDCTMYKLNQFFVPVVFLAILHVLSTTFSVMYTILCPIRMHSNFIIFHLGQGILHVALANAFLNPRKPVVNITLKMVQKFENKQRIVFNSFLC